MNKKRSHFHRGEYERILRQRENCRHVGFETFAEWGDFLDDDGERRERLYLCSNCGRVTFKTIVEMS